MGQVHANSKVKVFQKVVIQIRWTAETPVVSHSFLMSSYINKPDEISFD